MAAATRRATGQTKADILRYLETYPGDGWVTTREVATAVGVAEMTARGHMSQMVRDGKLESRTPSHGGGYRLRQDAAAKAAEAAYADDSGMVDAGPASVEDILTLFASHPHYMIDFDNVCLKVQGTRASIKAQLDALTEDGDLVYVDGWYRWPTIEDAQDAPATPPAPHPAMAPTTDRPEQPATMAPEPPPETPPASAPGAGDEYKVPSGAEVTNAIAKAQTFAGQPVFRCVPVDDELDILCRLASLEPERRESLIQFAVAKWWLK
jgi:hypothetical protein